MNPMPPSKSGSPDPEILFDTRQKAPRAPRVSIIIPMYNVRAYIDECLGGVMRAAEELDLEILLIDDGSSDGTSSYLLSRLSRLNPEGVLLLRQDNRGLSAVRNLGVRLARGEYLGFLDSDDLMVSASLRELLDFGDRNGCDLVLGRSFVFDSRSQGVSPFYDAWAWERLLQGKASRVISRHEDPELYFLEPNANYRLMKRSFYLGEGFIYPEGRLFEDPPVHYEMLAKSRRVGLLNVPYYGYRVNRPGKITEERSHRRFDILAVADETFRKLEQLEISEDAGGVIVYGMTRIIWWCGTMTLPEDRTRFFEEAIARFDRVNPAWIRVFRGLPFPDEILHLVMGALIRKDLDRLIELSQNQRNPLRSFFYLLRLRRFDLLVRHLRARLPASRFLPLSRKS